VNLNAGYRINPHLRVFARGTDLFDWGLETFALPKLMSGGVHSNVQISRPLQRFATLYPHEAVRHEQGLNPPRRVDEASERIPKQGAAQILCRNGGPHIPPVARVGERQHPPAAAQSRLKQRLVGRVTANHPIHGHHVRLHNVSRDGHEVAVYQVEAIGKVAASSLLASSCKVGRRCLHSSHPFSTRSQELEAERADTGAHIQHGLPIPGAEDCIPQQARRLIWSSQPVALEIATGDGVAELALVNGEE
jgi:hypothetical protein